MPVDNRRTARGMGVCLMAGSHVQGGGGHALQCNILGDYVAERTVGVGLNHLPLGPVGCQRRLAGRPGDGAQPSPLDGAYRSGRAGGDHQDPSTTVLLPRRTTHPLGAPLYFATPQALALGKPVQSRPHSIASPSISCLTAPSVPDPSTRLPNRLEDPSQVGPRASLAAYRSDNLAKHRHCGPSTSPLHDYRTLHTAKPIGIKPSPSLSLDSHPSSNRHG